MVSEHSSGSQRESRPATGVKGWIKRLFAPAEDPRQTYGNAFERQRQLLATVQRALLDIGIAKQRMEVKTAEVEAKVPQLEDGARRSLIDGREDLARQALRRAQVATVELQTMRRQLLDIEEDEHRLALVERRLSLQIEAFFARQELLAARYSAAEAQVQISEAITGVSAELAQLAQGMEQAERKSERMQARALAIDRLIDEGLLELPSGRSDGPGPGLVQTLAQADADRSIDEWLEQLKQEIA
jgi:phage shock protein A